MSNTGGKISAPVDTYDVSKVLGVASLDIGTLCTSSSINKWAKYKPVNHGTLGILSTTNYPNGLKITPVSLNDKYDVSDVSKEWLYLKPLGGLSSPYRLTDFNGYNHNSPAAYWIESLPQEVYYDKEYSFNDTATQSGGQYNLGLNDLLGTTEIFIGIIVRAKDGSFLWYSTRAAGNRPIFLDFKTSAFWNNTKFERDINIQLFYVIIINQGGLVQYLVV